MVNQKEGYYQINFGNTLLLCFQLTRRVDERDYKEINWWNCCENWNRMLEILYIICYSNVDDSRYIET